MAKFVIFKDRAGYYRWRLVAGNSEIVAASEAYVTKQNAARSVLAVKRLAAQASAVDATR